MPQRGKTKKTVAQSVNKKDATQSADISFPRGVNLCGNSRGTNVNLETLQLGSVGSRQKAGPAPRSITVVVRGLTPPLKEAAVGGAWGLARRGTFREGQVVTASIPSPRHYSFLLAGSRGSVTVMSWGPRGVSQSMGSGNPSKILWAAPADGALGSSHVVNVSG